MDMTQKQLLAGIMTDQEIAETHAKLAKLGPEGSKAREVAFDFMRLATVANKFRFHDKADLSDFYACADQFLSQAAAVKDTHGFTYARISSGIEWLRDNGFDYTYGRLDVQAFVTDARIQLQKRAEFDKARQEQAKAGKSNGKGQSWQ